MKTTIKIADDLLAQARQMAKRKKTTLRALAEEGLRLVLSKEARARKTLPPLVTFRGQGEPQEFKDWNWDKLRDEVYRGCGS